MSDDGNPYEEPVTAKHENVLQEHFWFTATVLAVNGFLMSDAPPDYSVAVAVVSTLVSLYGAYLIVERSAAVAGKINLPEELERMPTREKTWREKWRETQYKLRIAGSHVPFVVCELSGAFFYLVLVVFSWLGVLAARLCT